jgi:hypothetical protein
MKLRLDFGEKLDLSKFRKQAAFYISTLPQVNYYLVLPHYKVIAEVVRPEGSQTGRTVTLSLTELTRDKEGEIIAEKTIVPLIDNRFQEIEEIKKIFVIDHYEATFDSNSPNEIVDKICHILKVVHKINRLKVFL